MGKKSKTQGSQQPKDNKQRDTKPKIGKQHSNKNTKGAVSKKIAPKMVNLFKIIPEHDDFAALGEDVEEDQVILEDGVEEEDFKNGSKDEEFEGEDEELGEDEEFEGEDQDEDGEEEDGQFEEGDIQAEEGEEAEEGDEQEADIDGSPALEQQQDKEPVDVSVLSLQIQETISILMNIERLGDGKPRKHFINQLRELFHKYYGYNFELIDHFLGFLNPAELVQLFEANEVQRPLTIRTNTLKTRRKELAQSLIQRGVNLDPLAEWSKVGIKIYESKVPIGATPEYLAGHYMLQSASSLLPVIALDPQPGERILDMAAAPGGKTSYIAQLMKNTGCVFANDLKKERLKALQFNLYRLGVTNTTVTCRDGRKYSKLFPNSFDRVLLDAPCTGLGIISKDYSIKANRVLLDIQKNSHMQKQLLMSAIDCTRVGGVIVYSTCSVSPLQNEEVVNFALKKRFVKIMETESEVGEEGLTKFVEKRFSADLRHTRRIYPHVHNMDGFYFAKLVKTAKGKKVTELGEEGKKDQ